MHHFEPVDGPALRADLERIFEIPLADLEQIIPMIVGEDAPLPLEATDGNGPDEDEDQSDNDGDDGPLLTADAAATDTTDPTADESFAQLEARHNVQIEFQHHPVRWAVHRDQQLLGFVYEVSSTALKAVCRMEHGSGKRIC
eukprot:1817759-Alexandrium_andersonii.AAC.1